MVSSRRFAFRLTTRLLLLLAAAGVTAELAAFGRAPTATLLAFGSIGIVGVSLWRLVTESNRELARFVTALERGDLAQSFRRQGRGAGFEQVGAAYERALDRLRDETASGAVAMRFADALVDGAPTALLVLCGDDQVQFANKAARRLFGRGRTGRIAALAPFGSAFVAALRGIDAGATVLTHLRLDGLSQRVALDATAMTTAAGVRRIVSVRVIQAELDAAELAAQIDLVRVLTHEVMNSLTPVTSLAASAARLIDTLDPATAGVADAQLATAALARRAAQLERFVDSYKDFSAAPTIDRARIGLAPWLRELANLFAATPAAAGVAIDWPAAAPGTIDGDVALLTQVMLNLLKNAGEAAASSEHPRIEVAVTPAENGRLKIVVADNGPGIDPAIATDVFLPFFTTKRDGTGVGLSFARKIVLLHGGQIGFADTAGGRIELLLPEAPPE